MKAIRANNISKAYQIGEFSTGTITSDIHRWWTIRRGKEDPYLKVGEANDRTQKGASNIVWSLRDINFEIEQGEAVGIIGRNGAGKSTLLKILSRVTTPTSGEINVKGRIASLLEVGTGFHPELTGRENIYLNGAILGMRKREITRKFDEIVDFAGIERYIDTPVKRYSSGMYVRLAFAVAAHLESEILIIDEVLAVGDLEFQAKCLGKMNDVSKGEGRTVLFVSHQMSAIEKLCRKVILMNKGAVEAFGPTKETISLYLHNDAVQTYWWKKTTSKLEFPEFTPLRFSVMNMRHEEQGVFANNQPVLVYFEGLVEKTVPGFCMGFALYTSANELLFWSLNTDKSTDDWIDLKPGVNKLVAHIPAHFLNEGDYRIELMASVHNKEWFCEPEVNAPAISFTILSGLSESPLWQTARPGLFAPILNYDKLSTTSDKMIRNIAFQAMSG